MGSVRRIKRHLGSALYVARSYVLPRRTLAALAVPVRNSARPDLTCPPTDETGHVFSEVVFRATHTQTHLDELAAAEEWANEEHSKQVAAR